MIISASYRSDIPAFHASWFLACLEQGKAVVANPYSGVPAPIDLRPQAVDAYVFWTRNPRPFRSALDLVRAQARPAILQFTILGYPRDLDPNVPAPGDAIAQAHDVAGRLGPRAVVWRYDPIILTRATEIAWHKRNFARLASMLKGASDEVVISFAQIYAKSARNLSRSGISWRDPTLEEKSHLAADLAEIAAEHGIALSLCAQPELAAMSGLAGARCIDPQRLCDVAGHQIAAPLPARPTRPGCLCAAARDIGAYDTCAHGCRYCYAVRDHEKAAERVKGGNGEMTRQATASRPGIGCPDRVRA